MGVHSGVSGDLGHPTAICALSGAALRQRRLPTRLLRPQQATRRPLCNRDSGTLANPARVAVVRHHCYILLHENRVSGNLSLCGCKSRFARYDLFPLTSLKLLYHRKQGTEFSMMLRVCVLCISSSTDLLSGHFVS